ncbi:MAG: DUF91 domain-containing protein [Desulfurococcales archaeon]|nr:DUF91 domain-containing protein [Desulfurococcales archaeon]
MCLKRLENAGCVPPEELPDAIKRFFRATTIILFTNCSLRYVGRASSLAERAWRVVIIKEDGTVLVHEGRGRNPINWQPKAYVTAEYRDGEAVIKAVRARPHEELEIRIHEDSYLLAVRLSAGKFLLKGSEEDLVEKVAGNPSLVEEGAVLVSREVSTPHGRIDVVLRGRDGKLILVEAKRSSADIDAVYQLRRYVEYYRSLGVDAEGVLASPSVTPKAKKLLSKYGFRHVEVTP